MKNLLTSILCVVALLSVSLAAHSARIATCTYNGQTKRLTQQTKNSQGEAMIDFVSRMDSRYEKAFRRAADALNQSAARIRVNVLKADKIGLYRPHSFWGNGLNDVSLVIGPQGHGDDGWKGLAPRRIYCPGGLITEADIYLNIYTSIEASSEYLAYGLDEETLRHVNGSMLVSNGQNWPSTAMHELGHAFGLDHTPDRISNMGIENAHHYLGLAGKVQYYVGEDMTSGLVSLYGTTAGHMEDLGINREVFFATNNDGYAVSKVAYVEAYGGESHRPYFDNDLRYGEMLPANTRQVKLMAGLENNGKSLHKSVKVEYYFSTNSVISKYDRLLKTKYFYLSRDRVYYPTEVLDVGFLADEIRSGQRQPGRSYYIGVMIDSDDQISETILGNNTAAFPFNM